MTPRFLSLSRRSVGLACLIGALFGCASVDAPPTDPTADYVWLNRLTWGANNSSFEALQRVGRRQYLQMQLHPASDRLSPELQARIDGMTISQTPLVELAQRMEQRRLQVQNLTDETARQSARQAYQQDLQDLAQENGTRHYLRALYATNQVQEQMVWFWLNHFSVFQGKANLRLFVGDYEEQAIRPHVLGKFRDLLGAAIEHPAMLRYLDNEQNAVARLNENLARELMELHTLGVNGGYTQADVQALARVLTGVGISLRDAAMPRMPGELQRYHVRRGLFEFNPARHDFSAKTFMGQPIRQRGLGELDEVLDRLASHPATAALVCHKLAVYWLSDTPSPALEQQMVRAFQQSGGDIAATLAVLFNAPEFAQAGPRKFKDPMRFVLSALRLAYDQKPIQNARPVFNWLNRLGEPLFGRTTPDGYPLTDDAWSSSGQMAVRFEVAKTIGSGGAGLFQSDNPDFKPRNAFPQMANALYYKAMAASLGDTTRQALDQAVTPQEWNVFVLSSPEFMCR